MNLKEITKKRLIDDMIKLVKGNFKVLIVDHETMRIISFACRMYDIMEEGVTLVEKINIPRQPLPMEAIYFLSPTTESIELFIKDFQNPKEPQYSTAHLFFTSKLPDDLLLKIKENNHILNRIKSLIELNLQFIAYEMQVFHFDSPQSFRSLFSPESTDGLIEQKKISEKLISVCATLGEYPYIRYISSKDNTITHTIASAVEDRLFNLKKTSPDYLEKIKSQPRGTLIILDRSFDAMSPIMHEFTYQAMIYDLLKVENDHYIYQTVNNAGEIKKKEVIIGEQDPIWPTLRHQHIADTINWILDNFNDFMKENKASKLYQGKQVESLKEMSDAMKAMPQYQEMLEKYSLHINLSDECMKEFRRQQLSRIAALEQDMATGEDSEGKPVKNIISSMPPILTDSTISLYNKLRLLMIYIITQEGIKDADRKRLMDLAKISNEDQGCISNLRYLGVTLLRGTKTSKKKKKKKNREETPSYELSRYEPRIAEIIQKSILNSLSLSDFPYIGDVPEVDDSKNNNNLTPTVTSLRKGSQPRWADKNQKKEKNKSTLPSSGRLIIFVVGGITYSEMRITYELSKKFNKDIVIGSTSILTPQFYIDSLRDLKKIELINEE